MKKNECQRIKKTSKLLVSALMAGAIFASPSFADDVYVSNWLGLKGAVAGDANPINVLYNITRGADDEDITISRELSIIGTETGKFLDGGYTDTVDGYKGLTVEAGANLTLTNINMINFKSDDYGGAIKNDDNATPEKVAKITSIEGNFSKNSSAQSGGAIYNRDGIIGSIDGNFNRNFATNNGGAIYNTKQYNDGEIKSISGDFTGNTANGSGGAIHNKSGTITDITGDFTGNTANGSGGAISNEGTGIISNISGNFTKNSAKTYGGVMYNANQNGTVNFVAKDNDITFDGNYVTAENGQGGAISNVGTVGLYANNEHSITFLGEDNTTQTLPDAAKDIDGIFNIGTLNINGTYDSTNYTGDVFLYNVSDFATARGATNIYGGKVNVAKDITQKAINVANGATLTTNGNVTTTDGIANAGTLNLLGGTKDDDVITRAVINSTVSGDGTTNFGTADSKAYIQTTTDKAIAQAINLVNADVIANSALGVSGKEFNISDTSTLTIAANNIMADVANSGTLNLGAGTLENAITGDNGSIITTGNVSSLANYLGNAVTNTTGNTLTLTGGQLDKAISGGNVTIDGDVTSNVSIASAIGINSGKSLTISADNVDGAVTNAGALNLTGGQLDQNVTGGNVTIDGNVISSSSIISDVTINGSSSLEIAANQIGNTADGKTNIKTNDGTVILNGNVLSTVLAGAVQIKSGATVQSDIANFIGTLENLGTYNMLGNLSKDINGSGTTVLQNDVVTANNGVVIAGILDGKDKTIDMQSDPATYNKFTVGGLKGTTNLKIDVNMANKGGSGTLEHDMATDSNLITLTGTSVKTGENNAVLNIADILAYGITDVVPKYGTQTYTDFVTYVETNGAGTFDNLTFKLNGYEKGDENAKWVATVYDSENKPQREYTYTLGDLGKLNVDAKDTTLTLEQFITGSTDTETNSYEIVSNYTTKGEEGDLIGTTALGTGGRTSPLTVKLVNGSNIIAKTEGVTEGITVANGITLNLQGVSVPEATPAAQGKMTGFNTALKVNEGAGNVLNVQDMILTGNNVDIENNATLNLAGANTIDKIIGTGTTTIGNGITTINNEITQDNLVNNALLIANADVLNIEDGVTNNDTLVLNGGTLTTDINGGNVNISDKVNKVINNAIINVSAINIFNVETPSELENNNIIIANNIDNAGVLTANNNSYIKANINGGTFNSNGNNTVIGSIQDNGETNPATLNLKAGKLDVFGNINVAKTVVGEEGIVGNHIALNYINDFANVADLGALTLNDNMDLFLLADITNGDGTMNQIKIDSLTNDENKNINMVLNMPSRVDTILTNPNIKLNPIAIDSSTLEGEALRAQLAGAITHNSQTVTTPIFNYTTNYDKETGLMNFVGGGGYEGFNPSIMAGAVAAQMGGYLNQLNSYENAFTNMDMYMLMTQQERTAMKMRNKLAGVNEAGLVAYDPTLRQEEQRGLFFRPYASFEKVNLQGGPKVENNMYGSFLGGDSDLIELKNGWDVMYSAYASYDGSHQNYDGVSIYQNGGHLGGTAVFYKDNFFTGLTANVGASVAEASTMYGTDDMTMLMAGIASKTGYNWELLNSKLIIQPSMLLSYSFVNMFDYTNKAGVAIDSDPLHAIQIAPGLKFIGNLPNGWQPYISTQMVWNIMDDTKFQAVNVNLPQLSVKPYFQYGIGLQKKWGERFSGFGQVMLRNGGRTGVALSAGFRWALGKDVKNPDFIKTSNSVPELPKTKMNLRSANK